MLEATTISTILVGVINAFVVSILLLSKQAYRKVHSWLVLLMLLLVARSAVYLLGQQSLFDPHSWLFVPPVEVSFAYGPCIYLFIRTLFRAREKNKDVLHFLPLFIQVLYYASLVVMPVDAKFAWLTDVHLRFVSQFESVFVVASLFIYTFLSWRLYYRYQNWLDQNQSDSENFRIL